MAEVGALRITLGLNSIDFTRGMQDVNRRLTALNSEFRAISTGAAKFDNSLETLRSRADVLSRAMDTHRAKVEELRRQYEHSKATKGEDADETVRLATAYNRAVSAMNNTEQQLRNVNRQIENQTSQFRQIEREVNTTVDGITRQLRVLDSGFAAATTGVDGLGDSIQGLQQRQQHLTQTMNLQADRVRELARLHQAAVQETGQDSAATQELEIRLNRATQQMRETERQIQQTTNQIQQQSSAWNNFRQRIGDTGQQMQDLGGRMQATGAEISQTFGAAFLAVGAGLGLTAKSAMDFESQMSSVKSVMSPKEVDEFGVSLEDLAMKMGAETKYSALEAAQGIEELIKAGVQTTDIINGGLEGALSLAVAGELELADAAEIASTALNAFKKDSLTVIQAADLLAGAANASATSVSEMKFSLSMVSAVASGVGLSFKDTTAALAVFAQNGLKGSDAGTSLKTMLLNLSPNTKEAAEQMKALGLLTAKGTSEFYNANGSIKSMAEIAELLKTKLAHLSDEQRQVAMRTMFGTDAIRAANILYKEGAVGITNMVEAMTKISAADVAATKLDNVRGRLQLLKGTVETAAISFGNALLPTIDKVIESVGKAVTWFNSLSDSTKENIAQAALVTAGITGITAAFGVALTVIGGAVSGVGALTTALGGAAGAVTLLTGPVGLIAAGLGVATAATIGWMNAKKKTTEVTVDSIEKTFESIEAQQKEIQSNNELIKNYEDLRFKNRLTNDEMLRFLDIQSELNSTVNPETIARLKEEQAQLMEKSGLTNQEMEQFLSYNNQIIEKAPNTNKAISEQGKAFATNADELKKVNEEKLRSMKIDAEKAITNTIDKENELLKERKEMVAFINNKEAERIETYKNIDSLSAEIRKKEAEIVELKKDRSLHGQEVLAQAELELKHLQEAKTREETKLNLIIAEIQAKQDSLEVTEKDLKKLDEQKYKYEEIVLATVGLTSERGKGLDTLNQEIQRLTTQKSQLADLYSAGKLNTDEYNRQVGEIDSQISKLQGAQTELRNVNVLAGETVYKEIKVDPNGTASGTVQDINNQAGLRVLKEVNVTDHGGAKAITNEASLRVIKEVGVSANPSVDSINRELGKTVYKKVVVNQTGANPAYNAMGTRYFKGGLSWVGEKGRELTYTPRGGFALIEEPTLLNLPSGTRVIPNWDTEKILQNWNIPKMSSGGVTIKEGWAIAGERGREIVDLTGAMTSPLSGSPSQGNSQPVLIEIPIYLDSDLIGRGTSGIIDNIINSNIQTKLFLNGVR